MEYMLVGNYGCANVGDEALKEYFLTHFPDVRWQVLSSNARDGELPFLPAGLRSLFRPWWRTISAIRRSNGVVFGGGSLFTDVESVYACFLWWWHAFVAHAIFGKPLVLAFQGMGPFQTKAGEWCARWVVKRASYISVRDPSSFERVRAWQLRSEANITQTFDPVFLLCQKTLAASKVPRTLIIIPRANGLAPLLEALPSYLEKDWLHVSVLALAPADRAAGERVRVACIARMEKGKVTANMVSSVRELCDSVGSSAFVLTERYHGAVCALALGIPFAVIRQSPGDKLDAIQSMQREECEKLAKEGEDSLRKALISLPRRGKHPAPVL